MITIIQNCRLAIIISLSAPFLLNQPTLGQNSIATAGEEMIAKFDKIIPQVDPKSVPKDAITELKNKGETYVMRVTIQVVGEAESTRLKEIFKTKVRNIRFLADVRLREKIIDVKDGVIRSEIVFVGSNARLEAAKGSMDFYGFSANPLVNYVAENREKLTAAGYSLSAACVASGHPFVASIVGLFTRHANKETDAFKAKGYRVLENGEVFIPPAELRRLDPQVGDTMGMIEDTSDELEGARVNATWEWGRGYTSLIVDGAANRLKPLTEEQKELLTKMIYRSSMLSAGMIFPDKEVRANDKWTVDAGALGGMLTRGVQYDYLSGKLHVVYAGVDIRGGDAMKDEVTNTGNKEFALADVAIDVSQSNEVKGKIKDPGTGKEDVSFSIKPSGNVLVINDKNIKSRYIREADLTSDIGTFQEKYVDQMLRGVKITRHGKMDIHFEQTRIAQ